LVSPGDGTDFEAGDEPRISAAQDLLCGNVEVNAPIHANNLPDPGALLPVEERVELAVRSPPSRVHPAAAEIRDRSPMSAHPI
jgi:hypothetical protein